MLFSKPLCCEEYNLEKKGYTMYEYEYEYVSQMLSRGFSISNMKRVVTASIWVMDLQSGAICLENPPGESGFITGGKVITHQSSRSDTTLWPRSSSRAHSKSHNPHLKTNIWEITLYGKKAPVLGLQGRIVVDNFVETPPPEVARKKGVVCGNPLQNKDFTRWLQLPHLFKYATSFSIAGKSATLM